MLTWLCHVRKKRISTVDILSDDFHSLVHWKGIMFSMLVPPLAHLTCTMTKSNLYFASSLGNSFQWPWPIENSPILRSNFRFHFPFLRSFQRIRPSPRSCEIFRSSENKDHYLNQVTYTADHSFASEVTRHTKRHICKGWRFRSSVMWHCIVGPVVPDVSQDRNASFFRVKQSKKNEMLLPISFVSSLHFEFKTDQMLLPSNLKYVGL